MYPQTIKMSLDGRIEIVDANNGVVAVVSAEREERDHSAGHLVGRYVRGPAYDTVAPLMAEFFRIYDLRDIVGAEKVSHEIDRLGLRGRRADGTTFRLFSTYFEPDGSFLTFCVEEI